MYTRSGIFRRFAFMGFSSIEEASSAVKYFNKTFINTLKVEVDFAQKVGSEALNRPWSKYSEGSSANNEHLRIKSETVKEREEQGKSKAEAEVERKKKLLESIYGDDDEGKRLREFVSAMKPASKTKTWENDAGGDEAMEAMEQKAKTRRVSAKSSGQQTNSVAHGQRDNDVTDEEEYQDFSTNPLVDEGNIIDEGQDDTKVVPDHDQSVNTPVGGNGEIFNRDADLIIDTGRLFVRNLSYFCAEEDLKKLFEPFGALSEVHLSISKETKKPKGFAHVLFMFPENALKAYSELDGTIFMGRILHIIPSQDKPVRDESKTNGDTKSLSSFKSEKEKRDKAKAENQYNWNTLFLRSDTVLDAIAAKLGVQKSSIMDIKSENLATRLAIAETNLIHETKAYLEDEGVVLDSFMSNSVRSNSVILVKNLPFDTEQVDLIKTFGKFGSLGRVILPPTRGVALVEFVEASEAKNAFRNLAYSRYKSVPLFLEWAPTGSLKPRPPTCTASNVGIEPVRVMSDAMKSAVVGVDDDQTVGVASNTLYIKNLNFETTFDTLKAIFSSIGPVRSAKVATKKTKLGKELSLGFGFIEFERPESVNRAIDELQGQVIDGHAILIKKAKGQVGDDEQPNTKRKSASLVDEDLNNSNGNTKLMVRNVPFEATEKDIRELFKSFAQLKRVRLPRRYDGRHRGFGFVEFLTHQEALNARNALAHTHLYGRHLVIEWAQADLQGDEEVEKLREKSIRSVGGDIGSGRGKKVKLNEMDLLEDSDVELSDE